MGEEDTDTPEYQAQKEPLTCLVGGSFVFAVWLIMLNARLALVLPVHLSFHQTEKRDPLR